MMDKILEQKIIEKANKIKFYRMQPQTDAQYMERKQKIYEQYRQAKKKYLSTFDKTYISEMISIKKKFIYNISKTEYELCKIDIEFLREKYYNPDDDGLWLYVDELINN